MDSNKRIESKESEPNLENPSEVYAYLVSKYRKILIFLRKADKNAMNSLSAGPQNVTGRDVNVTFDIYSTTKSDGAVDDASKCFTMLFNDLFLHPSSETIVSVETKSVLDKMKNELRILLTELESRSLKLISILHPEEKKHKSSISSLSSLKPDPTPSEDEVLNRRLISKLDVHLETSKAKNSFYQQLLDTLSDETKKSVLKHSIETCKDTLESCRLMLLILNIFPDSVGTYGCKLFKTLIDFNSNADLDNSVSPAIRNYGKSLLVLDAIPLLLNISDISTLEVGYEKIFELTLSFYSNYCLEAYAEELAPNKLHDGVKKSIASIILGTEINSSSHNSIREASVISTLNLLSESCLETISETIVKDRLKDLRLMISKKITYDNTQCHQLIEIIQSLNLEEDIPDDILSQNESSETSIAISNIVTPPKVRGRPKKQTQQSVIVGPEDGVKRNLQERFLQVQFVFYSVVQYLYVNCSSYLRSTRSKILIDFNNPIAAQLEAESTKGSSQRMSRSKTYSQANEASANNPSKKQKLSIQSCQTSCKRIQDESPLNSKQSKEMDLLIIASLGEAQKLMEFFDSRFKVLTKLWLRLVNSSDILQSQWYRRISLESLMLLHQYDKVVEFMTDNVGIGKVSHNNNNTANSDSKRVSELRDLARLTSCYTQTVNKAKAYDAIDKLLSQMQQCNLLDKENQSINEPSIEEYMTILELNEESNDEDKLGFLFFDSWSLMRYCTHLLMSILRRCIVSNLVSDSALGHTIVLSQFDWPRELSTYNQCISWIRKHKPKSTTPQCLSASTKFTYSDFFHCIKNPSIIEDFMALLCRGYTLDIKNEDSNSPNSSQQKTKSASLNTTGARGATSGSSTRSGKAITTRGVNKTVKEDLKIALVAQMRTSSVLIPLNVVSDFIQGTLLNYLNLVIK